MRTFLHPHSEYPEDILPLEAALWWRDNYELFIKLLLSPKYHRPVFGSNLSGNLLIYPPKCDIMENKMNGRKSKQPFGKPSVRNDQPTPFRWINIALTAEDLNTLERDETSLEQLSLAFIGLGVRGFGLSVKYDSARKSYAVSIYGSDSLNNGQPCGISGSSADLRDALCVSLYRFDYCLRGSFDGSTTQNPDVQSQRFR